MSQSPWGGIGWTSSRGAPSSGVKLLGAGGPTGASLAEGGSGYPLENATRVSETDTVIAETVNGIVEVLDIGTTHAENIFDAPVAERCYECVD